MKPSRMPAEEALRAELMQPRDALRTGPRATGADPMQWRRLLAPYVEPSRGRAALDLATSVVPYLALSVGIYFALSVSVLLALALALPAAAMLVRTFIIFHDCSHGSFLASRRANSWLGTALGLLLFSPFLRWRHDHAVHHATSGDLERRGVGDIRTLTVAEYHALSTRGRIGYRLLRNPIVMFGLGPLVAMVIGPRIVAKGARPRMRRSVLATNLALAILVGGLCWLIGWRDYLLVAGPSALLAGSAGIWLFYVQHQFEDAYWESRENWDYAAAALRGSSYLKLPKVLQFLTGNIGFHHVHHLSARIPNYNLQRAHEENPALHDVPTLSLWDGVRTVTLKLWDEDGRRLVTFSQARRLAAAAQACARA
jgi:acyl-lipid omega-6 desaturase (Delta-12 desaturase)